MPCLRQAVDAWLQWNREVSRRWRPAPGVRVPVTTGGLVISLDLELAWGVHDTLDVHGPYRANIIGAREVVPQLLAMFEEYGIRATWATVGRLFARTHEEAMTHAPSIRPAYANPRLDTYRVVVGRDERSDPLHYGRSLIESIASCPGQEIASHTFSHYYCLEPGQTRETFAADVASAVAIAKASGITMRSFVFPRNQSREDYLDVLVDHGFTSYRGSEPNGLHTPRPGRSGSLLVRGGRLLDTYLPLTGSNVLAWPSTNVQRRLVNVPASRFLRPVSQRAAWLGRRQRQRLRSGMRRAAESVGLYHIWWHPHNFGAAKTTNIAHLRRILDEFVVLRDDFGMRSYSMGDVAHTVLNS